MPRTWQCSAYKKYKFHAVSAHGWMQVGIRPLTDTALIISHIHSTDESIVYVHGNAQHTKYKFPCCARYWLNAVLHLTTSRYSIYHSSCMQHGYRHRLDTKYIIQLDTQTFLSCCIWQWSGAVRIPAKADTALVIAHEHSHLVLMYDVPVWFSACPLALIHVYKRSYPSLRCACGGRAERPQMVYMNDNTSLIHQIKFRHNLNPCAHPRWLVEWFSILWYIKFWPSIPK